MSNSDFENLKLQRVPAPIGCQRCYSKKFAYEFSYPLFLLFKRMYETGTIPKCYKEAIVTPIYKKWNKQDSHNHFSPHGFCSSKSTKTNLLNFWHKAFSLADIRSHFSIIHTDMSKAFDKILHKSLINTARWGPFRDSFRTFCR